MHGSRIMFRRRVDRDELQRLGSHILELVLRARGDDHDVRLADLLLLPRDRGETFPAGEQEDLVDCVDLNQLH